MKKWKKKTLVGAVALALAVPTISYAATSTDTTTEKKESTMQDKRYELLDQFKNGEITADELLQQFREMRPHRPHHLPLANLDDETRKKVEEIKEKVDAGEITKEEAKTQIQELGINPAPFPHLEWTDEQKQQLEDIRTQVESGELTREEAKQQLEELGIDLKGPHHKRHFDGQTNEEQQAELDTDL